MGEIDPKFAHLYVADGRHFVLDQNNKAVSVSFMDYCAWIEKLKEKYGEDRATETTARNEWADKKPHLVSTVFLGLDHGFRVGSASDYRPVLWETMVFGGKDSDEYCQRYTSHEAALAGHQKTVQAVEHYHETGIWEEPDL